MTNLYYECHITIEPVFDERLEEAKALAKCFNFAVADLLMQKRKTDRADRSKYDTFMTSRSVGYNDLETRMRFLIKALQAAKFTVWRYKIEDTLIDSKHEDALHLL